MSRTEENGKLIEDMTKHADGKEGSFGDLLLFQLGVIATFLGDISKSLAIITDKMTEEKWY